MNSWWNNKTAWASVVIVFAFFVLFNFFWNEWLLADWYAATADMWEAPSYSTNLLMLGLLWMAVAFTWIWTVGYENKGTWEGVRYGWFIAALMTGPLLVAHSWQAWPSQLVGWWLLGLWVEFSIAGWLLAWAYDAKGQWHGWLRG
tara:strand:- start:22 stop:456 length:435 start_codon:yes stop_codon:yes gene_type:complete